MSRTQRYELLFPAGLNAPAYLSTEVDDSRQIVVATDARFARLLVVLKLFRDVDTGTRSGPAQGWRPRPVIAAYLARMTDWSIDEQTVSAYASQLMRKLERAVAAVDKDVRLPLIERRRGLGMRLADGVEIDVRDESGADLAEMFHSPIKEFQPCSERS